MQLKINFSGIIIGLLAFISFACNRKTSNISQEKINVLAQNALSYALTNDCFYFNKWRTIDEYEFISVCKDLAKTNDRRYSTQFEDFHLKDGSKLVRFDTIAIREIEGKKVIMSHWSEIKRGHEFSLELLDSLQPKSHGVRSYILSQPEFVTYKKGYKVLFKITEYFEYPINYVYVIIETDQKYNPIFIQCKKPINKNEYIPVSSIPQDRPQSANGIDFYINQENILIAISDSLIHQYIEEKGMSGVSYRKVSENYYRSEFPYICQDNNYNYYETYITMQKHSDQTIRFFSNDTCEIRRIKALGNEYSKINFKKMEITWDSIVVTDNFKPETKKTIMYSNKDVRYRFLTLNQEIALMVGNKNELRMAPIRLEQYFTVNIYHEGRIIKTSSGNYFPGTLQSLNYVLLQ
ncbi:MAG TPA: hypothetical protein PLU49_13900 [Saprospiraceae bacterium]|nr:hypothetical protein [Saprospiraceae bacterium]